MALPTSTTRFANCSRWQARAILAVFAALLAWFSVGSFTAPPTEAQTMGSGGNDLALYRAIIDRVHDGEDYYSATGAELRAAGYPTASVFNWRLPTYAWLIGRLPSPRWWQVLMVLLAAAALALAYRVMARARDPVSASVGTIVLLGVYSWCLDGDAYLAQELFAAIGIVLALGASALGWGWLAVASGLGALFYRELALPFTFGMAVLAAFHKRWIETLCWFLGLALFAAFMLHHAQMVRLHQTGADRIPGSWLQLGGAGFLMQTTRMNAWLFRLPLVFCAPYLALCLLGLVAWPGRVGLAFCLMAWGYVGTFLIVGQAFNDYWGLLYAPLLPFGFIFAARALRDLWRAACAAPDASSRPDLPEPASLQ